MTKSLIIYFSKTKTTKRLAEEIAGEIGADLYEIREGESYTAADLNWRDPSCRANLEQADKKSRPAYAGKLPDLASYDRIIIGHPIWWGRAPRIIETVLDDLDLSEKTLASFATSGGSSYHDAQSLFQEQASKQLIQGDVLNNTKAVSKWLARLD